MKPGTKYLHCALFFVAGVLFSCSRSDKPTFDDTPTSGEVVVACDESYQPILQVEADTFMGLYKYAKVHVRYFPEAELFNQLFENDSLRFIVAARELRPDEKAVFEQRKIFPKTLKIAVDAVALIVNNDNTDTLLKYEQVRDMVQGKIYDWAQLHGEAARGDSVRIVFDRSGSCNTRYLQEIFLGKQPFPSNTYATHSNAEVVEYVSKHKNSIGVLSINWISDKDDPMVIETLKKVQIVAISPPDTSIDAGSYFKPYQAYLYLKQYPLIRDVYIINREGRNGLGTGFAAFIAGDQGQRLIKLMGMLPATLPVRIIQFN